MVLLCFKCWTTEELSPLYLILVDVQTFPNGVCMVIAEMNSLQHHLHASFESSASASTQNSKDGQIFSSRPPVESMLSLLLFLNSPPTAVIQPWRCQMLGSCREVFGTVFSVIHLRISASLMSGVNSLWHRVRKVPLTKNCTNVEQLSKYTALRGMCA